MRFSAKSLQGEILSKVLTKLGLVVGLSGILLNLNACGKFTAVHDLDVVGTQNLTSKFVGDTSNKVYSVGNPDSNSGPQQVKMLGDTTFQTSYAGDCPYTITSKIAGVFKRPNGKLMIKYTDTDAELNDTSSTANDAKCALAIAKVKTDEVGRPKKMVACGYNETEIDFSCSAATAPASAKATATKWTVPAK